MATLTSSFNIVAPSYLLKSTLLDSKLTKIEKQDSNKIPEKKCSTRIPDSNLFKCSTENKLLYAPSFMAKTTANRHVDVQNANLDGKDRPKQSDLLSLKSSLPLTSTQQLQNLSSTVALQFQQVLANAKLNQGLLAGKYLKNDHIESTENKVSRENSIVDTYSKHILSDVVGKKSVVKDKKLSKEKSKVKKKKACIDPDADDDETLCAGFQIPEYELESNSKESVSEKVFFKALDNDEVISMMIRPVSESLSSKKLFLNAISASLIKAPNFKNSYDPVRIELINLANQVAQFDPEFILKVALYSRVELNIRTTTNFLLAFASNNTDCRLYLCKYFKNAICLPSDWIEVAELYQVFHDQSLSSGALPTMLRKAMTQKFPDFDKYQLAKYNKDKSKSSKKNKKKDKPKDGAEAKSPEKPEQPGILPEDEELEAENDEEGEITSPMSYPAPDQQEISTDTETEEVLIRLSFTLKQLIRKLHIAEPVEHVMCLIGKKYPLTFEDFYQSRLPGTFDEERAGKRMKLPIPETWETQVSLKGNKASTWEDLIDHRKLPFMAMLRNIRNLIKAGISEKHHSLVLRKLADEDSVINSKQFPFRFFSAYEVLAEMEKIADEQEQKASPEMLTIQVGDNVIQHVVSPGAVSYSDTGRGRGRGSPGRRGRSPRGRGSFGRGAQNISSETEFGSSESGGRGRGRGRGQPRGGRGRGRGRGRGQGRGTGNQGGRKPERKTEEKTVDKTLISRYRKALDSAVKIATVHNIKPIRGTTIILCDLTRFMTSQTCGSAKGLGKPRTLAEVAVLLGLMCKYACEECQLIVYGNRSIHQVELEKGTILNNMESVLKLESIVNEDAQSSFSNDYNRKRSDSNQQLDKYLLSQITDRVQINNMIVLSSYNNLQTEDSVFVFLAKYRQIVNPELLFVSIDLSGHQARYADGLTRANQKKLEEERRYEKIYFDGKNYVTTLSEDQPELVLAERRSQIRNHENNIFLGGFSDQLLRFIAERGENGQLTYVENIDKAYNLQDPPHAASGRALEKKELQLEHPLQLANPVPRWRTARVFISSTFLDMHGERDLLTRFVFPELRSRVKARFINVYEVDLRWGITEEDSRSSRTLELCLSEVVKSDLFIGILGERYGWGPEVYDVPQTPEFDWIRSYPSGASVTELEINQFLNSNPGSATEKAFFYLRDASFQKDIPKKYLSDFVANNSSQLGRMDALKQKICTMHDDTGSNVYQNYPCRWGGVVDGKPMVAGLEKFGMRVLKDLLGAIDAFYPEDQDNILDERSHEQALHDAFISSLRDGFIGRKNLLKETLEMIRKYSTGMVVIQGKPGSGKSSLMATLVQNIIDTKVVNSGVDVLVHCVGAAPGSNNIVCTLRRICHELGRRLNINVNMPEDYKNLVGKFHELLSESSEFSSSRFLLLLDGVDQFDEGHQARSMSWLPEVIPKNVLVVVTVTENSDSHKSVQRRAAVVGHIAISVLDSWDKSEIVRKTLAVHSKRLDESLFNNQLKLLLMKKESNNPYFLNLACEELRSFGVFEKITDKLKLMPQTLSSLMVETMSRLETDIGRDLVSMSLSLLVCSRIGLSESEMRDLLSLSSLIGGSDFSFNNVMNIRLKPEDKLPPAVILRLIRALHCFLRPLATVEQGNAILSLAHANVRTVIQHRYMKDSSHEIKLHRLLAGYYYKMADPDQDQQWKGLNPKAFTELPYHLACSGNYKELADIICNLHFIESKCQLGLFKQILDDYNSPAASTKILEKERLKHTTNERVIDYSRFVSRNLHIISRHPVLTLQQALNEPGRTWPAKDAKLYLDHSSSSEDGLKVIQWINKSEEIDYCIRTLDNLLLVATCLAISFDNSTLAIGFSDATIKLIDLTNFQELRSLIGHSDSISHMCYLTSSRLCSASADGTLCLWDVSAGYRIATLKGHKRNVSSCISDPSGKLLVTVGWDFCIKLWNGSNGEFQGDLSKEQRPINCIAIHPEGQLIVTGSWDTTLKLWDVFNKQRKGILRGHRSSVRDIAFSPSGRHIASAALDGEVKLWSADNGCTVGTIQGHGLPINCITYTPSGQELITASDDHKVKVWSGNIGKPVAQLGERDFGPVMCVTIDLLGNCVAAGYHEGNVRCYEISTGSLEWMMTYSPEPISIRCIKFKNLEKLDLNTGNLTSNIQNLIIGRADGTTMILSASSGEMMCVLTGHSKAVMSLDCSKKPNGFIVTTSEDFSILLYKFSELKGKSTASPKYTLNGHSGAVTCCALNSDETKLATGSRDMSIIIWDLSTIESTGTADQQFVLDHCHMDWVNCCSWSNNNEFLVTGSSDFTVKLWDMKTGSEKLRFLGHMSAVSGVAYKYGCIVSSCNDGSVKVWSHKGAEVTTLHGHSLRANGCDIVVSLRETVDEEQSSDWATLTVEEEWKEKHEELKLNKKNIVVKSVMVASCSDDGTIRLWLPMESSELACLTGHSDKVVSLASGQSGLICSASLDNSIKSWKFDAPHTTPVATSHVKLGHMQEITCIVCSNDGALTATASRDGTIKLWSYSCLSSDSSSHLDPFLIRASDKSVNCICFLDDEHWLVSGSEDCCLVVWNIRLNDRIRASRSASDKVRFPFTSFAASDIRDFDDDSCTLVSTHMNTDVIVWRIRKSYATQMKCSISIKYTLPELHNDWILASKIFSIKLDRDGFVHRHVLITGDAGSDVHVSSYLSRNPGLEVERYELRSSEEFLRVSSCNIHVCPDIPFETSTPTWVTCIAAANDFQVAFIGDSRGQLSYLSYSELFECQIRVHLQFHTAKITCIAIKDNLMFTSSLDQTIKIWMLPELKQVGQFFCDSPVTAMTVHPDLAAEGKGYLLVCGSTLGDVYLLSWRQ